MPLLTFIKPKIVYKNIDFKTVDVILSKSSFLNNKKSSNISLYFIISSIQNVIYNQTDQISSYFGYRLISYS